MFNFCLIHLHFSTRFNFYQTECASTMKQQLWIWEGATTVAPRSYSIYNLESTSFHVLRKACPGSDVRCMCRVGKYMWVGTEVRLVVCVLMQYKGILKLYHQNIVIKTVLWNISAFYITLYLKRLYFDHIQFKMLIDFFVE